MKGKQTEKRVSTHLLEVEDYEMVENGFELSNSAGYDFYDQLQIVLADSYYHQYGLEDPDSYMYKYLSNRYQIKSVAVLKLIYESDKEKYDLEIKAGFVADIASGKLSINVGEAQVIEISNFNRNYSLSLEQIKRGDYRKTNTGYNTNLNSVVIKFEEETIMLIEGTNKNEDPSDWSENFNMINNYSLQHGDTPAVYHVALEYYRSLDYNVDRIIGNSQGGGSAVYIGLNEPNVNILAVSPSPQYIKDLDANGEYSNITIVYPSTDPLYNLSEGVGFETVIPGANIAYPEFGLNKFISLNTDPLSLLRLDIMASHGGYQSVVDYNQDGKISKAEEALGIELDDVVARSVFTKQEIGTNTSNGETLVLNSEHMLEFAKYLSRLQFDYLKSIVKRNDMIISASKKHKDNRDYDSRRISDQVYEHLFTSLKQVVEMIDMVERFHTKLLLANISASGLEFASSFSNPPSFPKSIAYTKALSRVITQLDIIYDTHLTRIINSELSQTLRMVIKNRDKFEREFKEVIMSSLLETARFDYVGHNGIHAICDTLISVISIINKELSKLKREANQIEECTIQISKEFESYDKTLAKRISTKSTITAVDSQIRLNTYQSYLQKIDILEKMNVLEQYQTLVDEGTHSLSKLISTVIIAIIDCAKEMLRLKDDILILTDYHQVLNELEAAKNPNYMPFDIHIPKIYGYNLSYDSNMYLGINDTAALTLIGLIKKVLVANDDLVTTIETNICSFGPQIAELENLDLTLIDYLTPRFENFLYDVSELVVQKDLITLNRQILKRVVIEINQAVNTLESQVEFKGKIELLELVYDFQKRCLSLSNLFEDIFN